MKPPFGLPVAVVFAALAPALVACAPDRLVVPLRYVPAAPEVDAPFRAQPPPLLPVTEMRDTLRETTLPNGVHVVLIERHDFPVVAARLVVDRGALDFDDPGGLRLSEMAYFYDRGGSQAAHEKTSADAAKNGFQIQSGVAPDFGWVAVRSGAEAFDGALGALASAIFCQLTAEEYDRRAVEWVRAAASRFMSMQTIEREVLFDAAHPYGYAGSGFQPITLSEAQSLHARLFQPEHATLVVVGDVTPADVDARVLQRFGGWKATEPVPKKASAPPPVRGPRVSVLPHRDYVQRYGAVFARGPVPASPDMEAFQLLARILGGSLSSKLFSHLRQETGDAYLVAAPVEMRRDVTWVSLLGGYDADKAVSAVKDVLAAIAEVRERGAPEEEVAVARETLLAGWRSSMETAEGAAERYASAIALGVGIGRVRDFPAQVSALRSADVTRVARTYMSPGALHVAFLGEERWLDAEELGMGGVTVLQAKR